MTAPLADQRGRTVLITGGTAGIGLATGLAFARRGARCVLTYAFGSADEDEVKRMFVDCKSPEPLLVRADVGREDDTATLMSTVRAHTDRVHVFISNATLASTPRSLDDYDQRAFLRSMAYGAWPLVDYLRTIRKTFLHYPQHVVVMSSDGPGHFSVGYDFVAAGKAVAETLVRYLTWHLRHEHVSINALRSRAVRTASFDATFGGERGLQLSEMARRFASERHFVPPEEVADAAVALCSGLMDAVKGQVLTIDRGTAFSDNLQRIYAERESLPLFD